MIAYNCPTYYLSLFILSIIPFLIITGDARCNGAISQPQYDTLQSLYESTNGVNWNWNRALGAASIWTFPNDLITPCSQSWQGLTCVPMPLNSSNCEITVIILVEFNLIGSLPSLIGNIGSLQQLNLKQNMLNGTIPSELGALTALQILSFGENHLTGSIPSQLGMLVALTQFDIFTNSLYGTIPTEIGLLNALLVLDCYANNFTGTIPTQIGHLKQLQEIILNHNKLQGPLPTEMGMLTSLQLLYLYDNKLNGSIPTELGQLSGTLTELKLYSNRFTGPIPSELGQLASLQYLYLDNNRLNASIPSELGQLTSLLACFLSANNLTQSIPTQLGKLVKLQQLFLYGNRLSGLIPSELSKCIRLEALSLHTNELSGSIPTEIGKLVNLQSMSLILNRLNGSLPTEIGQLTSLQVLDLFYNHFSGMMPSELGMLPSLLQFDVSNNNFTGTIPSQLGQIQSLRELILDDNSFKGSIPTELGLLSALTGLNLNSNLLFGSIPTEIGALANLQNLYLYSNSLTGTIPTEIGNLQSLQLLSIFKNHLNGSLPSELAQLNSLEILAAYDNEFTGWLPTELGQLQHATIVFLYSNELNGTIPTEFGQLSSVQLLYLSDNQLSGSLPSALGQLPSLQSMSVYHNNLQGIIPTQLGLLPSILELALYNNYFTGPIPSQLGQLSTLQEIGLYTNFLSGTVPPEIGHVLNLTKIYCNDNYLSGSIPTQIGLLLALQELYLQDNFFLGPLSFVSSLLSLQVINASTNLFTGIVPLFPSNVQYVGLSSNLLTGSLTNSFANTLLVQFIDISNNALTGSIPSSFIVLYYLQSLNLSSNALSQSIDNLIISASNASLQSIDVSNNIFSGTISPRFFLQPMLNTVLLFENCFTGEIPSELCDNKQLKSLFLDSLTGKCGSLVPNGLRSIIDGSIPKRFMSGSIPPCLWAMPQLQLLRLSGNGLMGSLGEVPIDSLLTVLVLSSNALTGSIPSSWQASGQWSQLDLSSNKLSGILSSEFAIGSDSSLLDLTVNRLSGQLPPVFAETNQSLSVLDGNVFQCQASSLPQQDPSHAGYVCGADDFDYSLEFSVAIVGMTVIVLVALNSRTNWIRAAMGLDQQILGELKSDALIIAVVACSQAVVLIIVFAIFKLDTAEQQFSTHSAQYTWTTTAAFLHGWAPVLLICLILLVTSLVWTKAERNGYYSQNHNPNRVSSEATTTAFTPFGLNSIMQLVTMLLLHIINITVVVVVNGAYVNAVLEGIAVQELFVIQLLLSVFKLAWNSLAVPILVGRVAGTLRTTTAHRTVMTLFALIGGPFISTFFTASSCFRNLFLGETAVSSTAAVLDYSCFSSCETICLETVCQTPCLTKCGFNDEASMSIVLTPPWIYSYQCTSLLVTNFVPVMIFTFTISGALLPLLEFLYLAMLQRRDSHALSWLPEFVQQSTMGEAIRAQSKDQFTGLLGNSSILILRDIRLRYLVHIAVLLTFGIASPLLSLLIAVAAVIHCVRVFAEVGRVMQMMDDDPECRNRLLDQFQLCSIPKHRMEMRIVMLFAGLFWGFFVFDMIGDVYGSVVGGWAVLAPCCICLVVSFVNVTNCEQMSRMWEACRESRFVRHLSKAGQRLELSAITQSVSALHDPQSTDDGFVTSH